MNHSSSIQKGTPWQTSEESDSMLLDGSPKLEKVVAHVK